MMNACDPSKTKIFFLSLFCLLLHSVTRQFSPSQVKCTDREPLKICLYDCFKILGKDKALVCLLLYSAIFYSSKSQRKQPNKSWTVTANRHGRKNRCEDLGFTSFVISEGHYTSLTHRGRREVSREVRHFLQSAVLLLMSPIYTYWHFNTRSEYKRIK